MNTVDPKALGRQIARIRKAQGLSQADLAKVSGIPITAIRRCEQSGSIPLERYLVLANTLKASLNITPPPAAIPQRYTSIQQVIRSSDSKANAPKAPHSVRKPRLGGLFGQMAQQAHRS